MNGAWQCSEKSATCIFKQHEHEIMVVIRREPLNRRSFTWVNIYRSNIELKKNEFLFWSELYDDTFILMDEYKYGIGQINSYFHSDLSNATVIDVFNARKRGTTETFGHQIRMIKKIMSNKKF